MLKFSKETNRDAKCRASIGTVGHIDPEQPPSKRKPFSNILRVPYVHKVELVLPVELYEIIKDELKAKIAMPVYSHVIMPLASLLEGDFFNKYIKSGQFSMGLKALRPLSTFARIIEYCAEISEGDILMLSEGRHGYDNVYCLRDGILTLALDKESYERSGLVGKPDGAKGGRGSRPRWIVEINLRLPSMLHGKKGFDRVVYAFKNALSAPVTWMFADKSASASNPGPIKEHAPVAHITQCSTTELPPVAMPDFQPEMELANRLQSEAITDLYEWFSLVSLRSPCIFLHSEVDPYISRYKSPSAPDSEPLKLMSMTWSGFMDRSWAHRVLVEAMCASRRQHWFFLAVWGFNCSLSGDTDDCVILKLPGAAQEYLLWELLHTS